MPTWTREAEIEMHKIEDGGQAIIAEVGGDKDAGMFVRIQSWDETMRHAEIEPFLGKRVRVTIETLD
jgi:hypothetical protein